MENLFTLEKFQYVSLHQTPVGERKFLKIRIVIFKVRSFFEIGSTELMNSTLLSTCYLEHKKDIYTSRKLEAFGEHFRKEKKIITKFMDF